MLSGIKLKKREESGDAPKSADEDVTSRVMKRPRADTEATNAIAPSKCPLPPNPSTSHPPSDLRNLSSTQPSALAPAQAPAQPRGQPLSANMAAMAAMRAKLSQPSSYKSATSSTIDSSFSSSSSSSASTLHPPLPSKAVPAPTSSSSSSQLVVNLPPKPTGLQKEDLRFSQSSRHGKKSHDAREYSTLHGEGSGKTLSDLIASERDEMSMDEVFARNVLRVGSRYKDDDFSSHKSSGAATGFDEEAQTDMTMFTEKSERLTAAANWERDKSIAVAQARKQQAVTSRCDWWMSSSEFKRHLLLSIGEHVTMVMTPQHRALVRGCVNLVPINFAPAMSQCEVDVWAEVAKFKSSLRKMWATMGKGLLVMETVMESKSGLWQTKLECVPVKMNKARDAPIYFKSAMTESLDDLKAAHSKIIEVKRGKKSMQFAVPKGFAYFSVEWDDGEGYAMLIDEPDEFPKSFGVDTVAGMIGVEKQGLGRKKPNDEDDKKAVLEFLGFWKDHDWTSELDGGEY